MSHLGRRREVEAKKTGSRTLGTVRDRSRTSWVTHRLGRVIGAFLNRPSVGKGAVEPKEAYPHVRKVFHHQSMSWFGNLPYTLCVSSLTCLAEHGNSNQV